MASQISRIIPLLIITLCCVGAVELGYSMLEYLLFRQPAKEAAAPGAPAAQEGSTAAGARRDSSIIVTRNLFGQQPETGGAPSRPAVDVAANLDKSDREIVLVGTIDGSEGTHRAIILDRKTRKQELYKEGDEVSGANIKEISRGKVILEVQGKEELLDMAEAASVRPAVKVPQQPLPRQPQPGGAPPGQVAQPEPGTESPVFVPEEVAPEPEMAPAEVVPEPGEAGEPLPETAPETVEPENVAPESPPPEVLPETAPPVEQPQAPQRRIIRPRIIRQ